MKHAKHILALTAGGLALMALMALAACGQPAPLAVTFDEGHTLMQAADYGLVTSHRAWDSTAQVVHVTAQRPVTEDYLMPVGKRSHCHNEGFEQVYTLLNPAGDTLLVEQRTYRDGVAFRYVLPRVLADEVLTADRSTYHVPAEAKRWMQRWDGPNAGYEHFFAQCEGGVSPEQAECTQWGYPALIELDSTQYVLLTEADLLRGHAGSMLESSEADRHAYQVRLFGEYPLLADGDGRWRSPWRVIIHGSLADIVESTLVTDVATPAAIDFPEVKPGPSSWIYWAYNHGSQDCDLLKQYVDLAAEMHWPYTLVDAEWDRMRGGTIEDVVNYAKEKGVMPMIWYNSTTNWTGEWAPTPQGLLNEAADREAEFAKIASWGVKGVKIDFFRADRVETIDYYIDLIESAARHGLMVNFHGGTIPRGWQRTYPNFISAEAVYGAEWYNNVPTFTERAARHNATLPFTRNVIGPMDYTPGTFTDSQHPHITTTAHELALTVLFESAIQHMPDRPSAYRALPVEVRQLLRSLPTAWDDTRFVAGYPGESVIIARRKGNDWYVAGINGRDEEQVLQFNLSKLGASQYGLLPSVSVIDSYDPALPVVSQFPVPYDEPFCIVCQPRGGFLIKTSLPN